MTSSVPDLAGRAAARHMLAAGDGAILNVIATYAWHGHPGTVHSAAAKGGVLAMTRTLAVEWGGRGVPAGRFTTPEEIAACALLLLDDRSRYVNGETLTVDGGQWLGKPVYGDSRATVG
jgi:hypothetical protein